VTPVEVYPGGYARRWRALSVLCLALSVIVIDNTILAVAFPSIQQGLHTDETGLQWIGSAYGLVLAGLLLPLAVVGDRRGRKGLLMLGLVIFGAASVAAAFATSAAGLAVARGVMGIGGACTMPSTLSVLGNIFPEQERGRAIAVWSGVAGIATAVGPVVGGLLLARFWWGSVFLVNVPIVLLALVLTARWVPRSHDPASPPVDRWSALLWWGALTAVIVAIVEGPQRGWGSPLVLTSGAAGVLLFVAFLKREERSPEPLIEDRTRRDPRLRWGAATVTALFFGVMGLQFVLTQWIQGPQHHSALTAGLYFVPTAITSLVFALLNTRWAARWGYGTMAAVGLAATAAGALVAALAVVTESLPGVVVAGALVGVGIGIAAVSGVELIMSSARPERAGSASGVNETLVEASGALGIALLGSVLVETGSYAWPLPVVALVTTVTAVGVAWAFRPTRASRRSPAAPTP
jgi:DHA2 family multidrug resistance protein-like MFS transporter